MQLAVKAKLYIPSTINISRKLLSAAIWADKKLTGFWQFSLYNVCTSSKTLKIIAIKIQYSEYIFNPKT